MIRYWTLKKPRDWPFPAHWMSWALCTVPNFLTATTSSTSSIGSGWREGKLPARRFWSAVLNSCCASTESTRILPHCGIGTRTIYPGGISLWKGLRNCFGSSQGNTGCSWSPTVRPVYRKGDWRARVSNRILRIFSYLRNWVRTSRTVVSLRPALPGSPLLTRSAASSSGTV